MPEEGQEIPSEFLAGVALGLEAARIRPKDPTGEVVEIMKLLSELCEPPLHPLTVLIEHIEMMEVMTHFLKRGIRFALREGRVAVLGVTLKK